MIGSGSSRSLIVHLTADCDRRDSTALREWVSSDQRGRHAPVVQPQVEEADAGVAGQEAGRRARGQAAGEATLEVARDSGVPEYDWRGALAGVEQCVGGARD